MMYTTIDIKQKINVSEENSLTERALNESFIDVLACLQLPTKIKVECNVFREQKLEQHN